MKNSFAFFKEWIQDFYSFFNKAAFLNILNKNMTPYFSSNTVYIFWMLSKFRYGIVTKKNKNLKYFLKLVNLT